MNSFWQPCQLGSDVSPAQADAIIEAFAPMNDWIREENARIANLREQRRQENQVWKEEREKEETEILRRRQETGLFEFIPDLLLSDNNYNKWQEQQYLAFEIQRALINLRNQPCKIANLKINQYYKKAEWYLLSNDLRFQIKEDDEIELLGKIEKVTTMKLVSEDFLEAYWSKKNKRRKPRFVELPPTQLIDYADLCSGLAILDLGYRERRAF